MFKTWVSVRGTFIHGNMMSPEQNNLWTSNLYKGVRRWKKNSQIATQFLGSIWIKLSQIRNFSILE